MATADELLAAAAEETPESESKILTVDNDLRTITIPTSVTILGVESDDGVLRLKFAMPRMCGEYDLSDFTIKVNYLNADDEGDAYPVDDAVVSDDAITFSWEVGRHALTRKGTVKFSLCLKKLDDAGIVVKEFNTTYAALPVLEGLETVEQVLQKYPDLLEGILQRLDDLEMEEPGTTTGVDATLTVEGKAADAKAVGDKLAAIPVTVSEDGYTDITGLRQIIGGSVVKDGSTITVTTTLQGGETHTDVITLNDDGYPSAIVSDGMESQWSWEGFEDVALQVWEGGSY